MGIINDKYQNQIKTNFFTNCLYAGFNDHLRCENLWCSSPLCKNNKTSWSVDSTKKLPDLWIWNPTHKEDEFYIGTGINLIGASQVAQCKESACQCKRYGFDPWTWVQSPGWEDTLKEKMATHSSIPAWKTPWTKKPGRLHSPWGQKELDMT